MSVVRFADAIGYEEGGRNTGSNMTVGSKGSKKYRPGTPKPFSRYEPEGSRIDNIFDMIKTKYKKRFDGTYDSDDDSDDDSDLGDGTATQEYGLKEISSLEGDTDVDRETKAEIFAKCLSPAIEVA